MEKEQIVKQLLTCFSDKAEMRKEIYQTVNEENWTLADLVIRQYLNNGGNGFGMKNVRNTYEWLVDIKEDLIKYDMINKGGVNNFGFTLWNNYDY